MSNRVVLVNILTDVPCRRNDSIRRQQSGWLLIARVIALASLFLLVNPAVWPQEQPSHHDHAGMSMPSNEPTQADIVSWQHESERNHHLVGFFIVLSGLCILAQAWKKLPAVTYAWPMCFLLSGLFVLVYSDTELWPFGPKPWIEGTITNPEVLQHKIFAVLLLCVGLVEMERARGRLRTAWAAWLFPALAIAGSLLLLFHSHNAGMRGPDHMAIMARIQTEHLSYAASGFGIGLAKGLAQVSTKWQFFFSCLWPSLMVVLGILLMLYAE